MLQTIVTARHISVQGEFVKRMDDGRVMVRVGQTYHIGRPVEDVAMASDRDALASPA